MIFYGGIMKLRFAAFTLVFGIILGSSAQAASVDTDVMTVNEIQNIELVATQATLSLINWKVGDYTDYKVTAGFGLSGTMHKEAFKEEGNGIWIKQQLQLPVANDTAELLLDRDSGKVLKYIHNGKEETYPDEALEVIESDSADIEVPAGKFHTMHVVAKSKNIKKIEIWINPRDIALDGSAKVIADQGMMKLNLELTKFLKQ